jgi:predicted RNase H-like nuclease
LNKINYFQGYREEIDETINYLENTLKNRIAAKNLYKKVKSSIISRANSIASYKKYYTKSNNVYYKINIKNYSILYTIKDNVMEVRRFLYNKMDLEKMNIIC